MRTTTTTLRRPRGQFDLSCRPGDGSDLPASTRGRFTVRTFASGRLVGVDEGDGCRADLTAELDRLHGRWPRLTFTGEFIATAASSAG